MPSPSPVCSAAAAEAEAFAAPSVSGTSQPAKESPKKTSPPAKRKAAFTLLIQGKRIEVWDKVDRETLARGPGWLPSSVYPGEEGTCIIYGHRNRTHLRILEEVNKGEEIQIPDVSGQTKEDAIDRLIKKGFKESNISVEEKESDSVDAGKVISTTPEAGSKATEDAQIVVYVSAGASKATVPGIVGKSQSAAEELLKSAGLSGSASEEYSDKPKGEVIWQDADSGTKVDKGTVIYYGVSKGPEPVKKVKVPSVLWQSKYNAKNAIESEGLNYAEGTPQYSDAAAGTVIDVIPGEGTEVSPGSTVTVVLSLGQKPDEGGTDTENGGENGAE